MSTAGERLLRSAKNARAYARGEKTEGFVVHVPEKINVKAVRKKLGMTQQQFASQFGFGYDALRDWESGRRRPERAARVLLTVIGYKPDVVQDALKKADAAE